MVTNSSNNGLSGVRLVHSAGVALEDPSDAALVAGGHEGRQHDLHGTVWRGVVWCGAVRCGVVWCGVV